MKTKYKFIYFKQMIEPGCWECLNNKRNDTLGYLKYYKVWKEYILKSEDFVFFSASCLDDISHFLKQLNAERSGDNG